MALRKLTIPNILVWCACGFAMHKTWAGLLRCKRCSPKGRA